MMVWGVPTEVKAFFAKAVRGCAKPIRQPWRPWCLGFLLAPHRRCLKTVAGSVLGHRRHVGTISRRLVNPQWKTRDWYVTLYDGLLEEIDRWERRQARGKRRQWIVAIDTTYHASLSEQMENLIVMSRRQDSARQTTRQHAFLMGLLLTDRGARLPLPRKSYYTEEYCRKHRRRFRTTVQLAAAMLRELRVPDDVDVVVVFDSAFDAGAIHRVCRQRGFRAVFPIDPNRVLARTPDQDAAFLSGEKVVAWTRSWSRKEFALIELAVDNEDHVFARRRHADNLRVKKTKRRYAVAARRATVSKLGDCLIVASYKENPKVQLLPGQSAEWWAYHKAPVSYRQEDRHKPSRWHGKVLACTDPTATRSPSDRVVRGPLAGRAVLPRVEEPDAVRVLRADEVRGGGALPGLAADGAVAAGKAAVAGHAAQGRDGRAASGCRPARPTDCGCWRSLCQRWNVQCIERRLRTPGGRRRVLRDLLGQAPCQVA